MARKASILCFALLAVTAVASASPILDVRVGLTGNGDNFNLPSGGRWDMWMDPFSNTVEGHLVTFTTVSGANWLHDAAPSSVGIILGYESTGTVQVTIAGFAANTQYKLTGINENAYEGTNVIFQDLVGTNSMINTPAMAPSSGGIGQDMIVMSNAAGEILFTAASGKSSAGDYHTGCLKGFDVTAVPEPATLSLLAISGLGMLIRRRRIA